MARAEISAEPIRGRRAGARLRKELRDAAEVGADPHQHGELRLDRAVPVAGVRRLLQRLGLRIGELPEELRILQGLKHCVRPVDDEDRPPAPAHHDLLPGLQMAQIDIDRAAGRERRGVGVHLADQRNKRGDRADCSDGGGRDVEKVAARRLGCFAGCFSVHARHGGSSSETTAEIDLFIPDSVRRCLRRPIAHIPVMAQGPV